MKGYWQRYAEKFNALSLRERVFIFFAVIVVLTFVPYLTIIDPLLIKQKKLGDQFSQQQTNINAIRDQAIALSQAQIGSMDPSYRDRLKKLRDQIGVIDTNLRTMQAGLMPPEKMAGLIENILKRNQRLQLVELRTLPVSNLIEDKKPAKDTLSRSENNIYKHGVEITLSGNYLDLLDYLVQLERLPEQMFWTKIKMDATGYPKVFLTATVYTLSLNRAWLIV